MFAHVSIEISWFGRNLSVTVGVCNLGLAVCLLGL